MSETDKFGLTPEEYLAKHQILVYLEDAVQQLIDLKQDYPKVDPAQFFQEYFHMLMDGNHTLYREYQFVHTTPYNRASFIASFWKCFRQIGKSGDLLNVREYHSLLCLICPNFPLDLVQKTARIIFLEDAMDSLTSFADFLYAFQLQLYYEEFLQRCSDIYEKLITTVRSPRGTVYIPSASANQSAATNTPSTQENSITHLEGVDSKQFVDAVIKDMQDVGYRYPPAAVLYEVQEKAQRSTFYGFVVALARSEKLNNSIGVLPPRAEVYHDSVEPVRKTSNRSGKVFVKNGSGNPD